MNNLKMPDDDNVVVSKADIENWQRQFAEMETMANNMKLQNDTLQTQVRDLTANQGAARQAVEDLRKRAQKLIQHQPKYTHEQTSKRTWQMFLSERLDFFEGHGITIDTIGEEYHKKYLMMALGGRAREMVVGIEDDLKAKPYDAMVKQLGEQFSPRFESELMKSQFKARKQQRLEDILTYLSSKEALYRRAYKPEERSVTHFMESAIANVRSDRVKEHLIMARYDPKNNITDYMHLRDIASSVVAMEREMYKAGLPNASTSLDGLAATSLAVTQGLVDDDEEPMDISKMEDRACFTCGKKGHLAAQCRSKKKEVKKSFGGKGKSIPGKGGKPFPFACRKCGTVGHKAKDCRKSANKVKPKSKNTPTIKRAGAGTGGAEADEPDTDESESDSAE